MRLFKPFLQPFKALVFVGVFGLASVSASACDWSVGAKESGSGNIESEARNVSSFTGVSLSLPARAEIVQCGSEGISIETDDNILPLIACRDSYLNLAGRKCLRKRASARV